MQSGYPKALTQLRWHVQLPKRGLQLYSFTYLIFPEPINTVDTLASESVTHTYSASGFSPKAIVTSGTLQLVQGEIHRRVQSTNHFCEAKKYEVCPKRSDDRSIFSIEVHTEAKRSFIWSQSEALSYKNPKLYKSPKLL